MSFRYAQPKGYAYYDVNKSRCKFSTNPAFNRPPTPPCFKPPKDPFKEEPAEEEPADERTYEKGAASKPETDSSKGDEAKHDPVKSASGKSVEAAKDQVAFEAEIVSEERLPEEAPGAGPAEDESPAAEKVAEELDAPASSKIIEIVGPDVSAEKGAEESLDGGVGSAPLVLDAQIFTEAVLAAGEADIDIKPLASGKKREKKEKKEEKAPKRKPQKTKPPKTNSVPKKEPPVKSKKDGEKAHAKKAPKKKSKATKAGTSNAMIVTAIDTGKNETPAADKVLADATVTEETPAEALSTETLASEADPAAILQEDTFTPETLPTDETQADGAKAEPSARDDSLGDKPLPSNPQKGSTSSEPRAVADVVAGETSRENLLEEASATETLVPEEQATDSTTIVAVSEGLVEEKSKSETAQGQDHQASTVVRKAQGEEKTDDETQDVNLEAQESSEKDHDAVAIVDTTETTKEGADASKHSKDPIQGPEEIATADIIEPESHSGNESSPAGELTVKEDDKDTDTAAPSIATPSKIDHGPCDDQALNNDSIPPVDDDIVEATAEVPPLAAQNLDVAVASEFIEETKSKDTPKPEPDTSKEKAQVIHHGKTIDEAPSNKTTVQGLNETEEKGDAELAQYGLQPQAGETSDEIQITRVPANGDTTVPSEEQAASESLKESAQDESNPVIDGQTVETDDPNDERYTESGNSRVADDEVVSDVANVQPDMEADEHVDVSPDANDTPSEIVGVEAATVGELGGNAGGHEAIESLDDGTEQVEDGKRVTVETDLAAMEALDEVTEPVEASARESGSEGGSSKHYKCELHASGSHRRRHRKPVLERETSQKPASHEHDDTTSSSRRRPSGSSNGRSSEAAALLQMAKGKKIVRRHRHSSSSKRSNDHAGEVDEARVLGKSKHSSHSASSDKTSQHRHHHNRHTRSRSDVAVDDGPSSRDLYRQRRKEAEEAEAAAERALEQKRKELDEAHHEASKARERKKERERIYHYEKRKESDKSKGSLVKGLRLMFT